MTDNQLLALFAYHQPWQPPVPFIDATFDVEDKKQLIWEFPDITWTQITGVTQRIFAVGFLRS